MTAAVTVTMSPEEYDVLRLLVKCARVCANDLPLTTPKRVRQDLVTLQKLSVKSGWGE